MKPILNQKNQVVAYENDANANRRELRSKSNGFPLQGGEYNLIIPFASLAVPFPLQWLGGSDLVAQVPEGVRMRWRGTLHRIHEPSVELHLP
jgi:hypothetical protein